MRLLLRLALAVSLGSLLACSSSDDGSSTATTNPSAGGSGGAGQGGGGGSAGASSGSGGSQAGSSQGGKGGSSQAGSGGSTQAGSGGSSQAGSGGSSQAGSGGSSAGSGGSSAGSGGSAGSGQAGSGGSSAGSGGSTAGSAGSAQAGGGQSGGGQGGAGQAGAAGQSGGGGQGGGCCQPSTCGDEQRCVEGECFDLTAGQCFTDADCGGNTCGGAVICPCGSVCKQGTKPGTCAGASAGWQSCGAPGECVLQDNSCCGVCGMPSASNVDAVNVSKIEAHQKAVCKDPNPICPSCFTQDNPDLLAVCALGPGKCTVLEVSKSSLSECGGDGDCVLQPDKCCACGVQTESTLVALNKKQTGSYTSALGCDTVDCAPCPEPVTTPGLKAVCDGATKHCRISKSPLGEQGRSGEGRDVWPPQAPPWPQQSCGWQGGFTDRACTSLQQSRLCGAVRRGEGRTSSRREPPSWPPRFAVLAREAVTAEAKWTRGL